MARPDKEAVVADVKDRFEASAALLLTNYRGLSVGELAELRAELRKANATYRVSKNTLIRRAMHDAGVDGLDEMLVGPTAMVFCADDPVGPAKALKAFLKDHPDLEFKGGLLEGDVLDAQAALRLADLESREDLLARLAGLLHGALANTARLLAALPAKQAQLIQALIDDGGHAGGDGADTAEVATQAAAEAETSDESPAATSVQAQPAADEQPPADTAVPDADEVAPTSADATVAAADEASADGAGDAGEAGPAGDEPDAEAAPAGDEPVAEPTGNDT